MPRLGLGRAVLQIDPEATLVILGDHRPLQLVALVREPETRKAKATSLKIFAHVGPGDDGPGLITVEMSPLMKPAGEVRATTIAFTVRRPVRCRSSATSSTIATSSSCGG